MLTKEEIIYRQKQCVALFGKAGIILTDEEKENIEIADFGLGEFELTGLALVVYVNTDRVCAKELAMLPGQTCPEHRHPPIKGHPGKEETFRVRWGEMYLYVPGEKPDKIQAEIPEGHEDTYTVFQEIVLKPGEQYTLPPNVLHWFQAGDKGVVVSEFSTTSTDEADYFTDPEIQRSTKVVKS